MDYREELRKKFDARERVVKNLKTRFFPNEEWSKISLKCSAWLSKLIYEGKKCWPEWNEWQVCDWIADQMDADIEEMVFHPDDRKNLSPMAKELKKHLGTGGGKDAAQVPAQEGHGRD